MNENYIVAQSNELIAAIHNKPLTSREQKIILAMVSEIQPNDEDFKEYRISLKNFNEMLGLKGSTKYTQIKDIMIPLMEKTIQIPRENKGLLLVHWVSSAEYIDGEGIIELTISPKLKPYLLQLQKYTSYKLSNILSLNSSYSIRLYEIIKRWSFLGTWECPLEELRGMIGVQENMYKQYGHFKARVLKRAVDEVNEKTDVKIVFEEIKKGRSVDKIKFTIRKTSLQESEPKKKKDEANKPYENEEIRKRLNGQADKELYQLSKNYFSQLYEGAAYIWGEKAENELAMLIAYVNVEESVKKPLGFIKSQIKLAFEAHERGEKPTFADLQKTEKRQSKPSGREEMIPDWFKKRDEPSEPKETEDRGNIEERREKLRKEIEEMSNRGK